MTDSNRRSKGESSRARLLEAATKQLSEKGYVGTKISDIVREAGLTQAAFYLYFPSKEALLSELVRDYRTKVAHLADSGKLVTPLQGAAAPEQAKMNVVNLFLFLNASPQLTRIALLESPESEELKREIADMIAKNLRGNQKAGHVRQNLPVEIAAECMVAVMERMVAKLIEEQCDPAVLAADIADVILYGILHRNAGGGEQDEPK